MSNITFAALKRRLTVGAKLTMVRHDWYPNGKMLGLTREIITVQSNGVALKSDTDPRGSWLYWPSAKSVQATETGFTVVLDPDCKDAKPPIMVYEYELKEG